MEETKRCLNVTLDLCHNIKTFFLKVSVNCGVIKLMPLSDKQLCERELLFCCNVDLVLENVLLEVMQSTQLFRTGRYHCTANLLFDWFRCDQISKYV